MSFYLRAVRGAVFCLMMFALTGCGSAPTTLIPTGTNIPTVQAETTPVATLPLPTATPTTAPPTATDAPVTPTLLPSPTADAALGEVKLVGLGWLEDYQMLLSFQFPGPVDPEDYQVKMEDKDFTCQVLAQFPNRLYCTGQGVKVLAEAKISVFPAGSVTPGFEKDVWVPYFNNDYGEVPK